MISKQLVIEILRDIRDEGKFNTFIYQALTKAIERIERL